MDPWAGTLAAFAVLAAALWLARRYLLVVRVDGTSMVPTFQPGEAVLARRRGRRTRPRRGQIVVCRLPEGIPGPPGLIIKRVVAVEGEVVDGKVSPERLTVPRRHVYLCGDGPRSYDSRQYGPLPLESVVGYVIARLYVTSPSE